MSLVACALWINLSTTYSKPCAAASRKGVRRPIVGRLISDGGRLVLSKLSTKELALFSVETFKQAQKSGVQLCLSATFGVAPLPNNICRHSLVPYNATLCNATLPEWFGTFGSAFFLD